MKLPSLREIEALHRKYARDDAAYQAVYSHCQIVWSIAEQLIQTTKPRLDVDLVHTGCLLHDIGVYHFEGVGTGKHIGRQYIAHGTLGYEILKSEGFPEDLCRFASHHTGVGLTKEEIVQNNLPLPHEDFLADTAEERVVMYADKFHSKSTPPHLNTYESYREHVIQFGNHKAVAFDALAEEFGKPDLQAIAAEYNQPIV